MVDLRAAGHTLRGAAKKVAAVFKKDGISWETLRSHYRELERAGALPKPSSHVEHKQEAMRLAYQRRTSTIEEARNRDLAAAEEHAISLGLDLSGNLEDMRASLSLRRKDIENFLSEDAEYHMNHFLGKGIRDPEEAAKCLAEMDQERELLARHVHALWEVIRLRALASKEP
jgi:DNA-binding transcriptional ArsR family regulator